jgi:O-antigen ligase
MIFSHFDWNKQQGWWVIAHALVLGALYFEQMATPALLVFLAVLLGVMLTTETSQPLNKVQKGWIAVSVAYASVLIASFFIHLPITDDGVWRLSSYAFILLLAGAFYLQTRIKIKINMILSLLLVSVVYASLVFALELSHYGWALWTGNIRLGGYVSDYGGYANLVMGTLIVLIGLFGLVGSKKLQSFVFVSISVLVVFVMLGGGRTSIWYMIVLVLGLLWFLLNRNNISAIPAKSEWYWLLGGVLVLMLTLGLTHQRIYDAYQDIQKVLSQNYNTSLGHRVVMAHIGWDIVKDSPMMGVGLNHFKEAKTLALEKRDFNLPSYGKQSVINYTHIHNQFLMDMILAGILGLLTLIAFLFYSLWCYWQFYQRSNEYEIKLLAMAGMFFIGYAVFTALFGCVFTYTYTSIFYMMMNGFILGYLAQHHDRQGTEF